MPKFANIREQAIDEGEQRQDDQDIGKDKTYRIVSAQLKGCKLEIVAPAILRPNQAPLPECTLMVSLVCVHGLDD